MSDYTEAKDIAFRTISLLTFSSILNHFRSHVAHRPTSFVGLEGDWLVEVKREPEVYDERLKVGKIDENILRLEVAVDDICLVDISNPLEDLLQQIRDDVRLTYLFLLKEGH